MASSWSKFALSCKSRLSALARSLFLSRRHWQEKYLAAKRDCQTLEETLAEREARCQELEQQQQDLARQVAQLQTQLDQPRPVVLPVGETPRGHQYGANLIALSVNLARELGIRPARRAMRIFLRG